jgi:ABC-type multidrug transport system permease subunit
MMNSVLASPQTLPRFWIFMYRVSPFTYLVSGMISVGLANSEVVCNPIEFLHFNPPSGESCGDYMQTYISEAGGYLLDENATTNCSFCSVKDTNTFLKNLNSDYSLRWRNFGLMWVFIVFNIFAAVGMYWLARVPKVKKTKKEKAE